MTYRNPEPRFPVLHSVTERRPGISALRLAVAPLVLLTVLAGCRPAEEPIEPEIRPVRAQVVEEQPLGQTVALTGTVRAQTDVSFSFRIDGRLIERMVDVGDTISPGQLLASLDPQNEESALQASRASLAAARGQLVEARNNFERQESLVERQLTSRAALDQATAVLQTAESQVDAAQANVVLAENRLSYTQLIADAGGVVVAIGADPGEVVGAGRMIVEVARDDGKDAVFDVPSAIKDAAPLNPEISVALTSNLEVAAQGRVREVSPQADPVTGTFRVRVGLVEPPPEMRLGSTVVGRMTTDSSPVLSLPGSALTRQGGSPAVWVVDPGTLTVNLRDVVVGRHDESRVVIDGGLQLGELVVTAGVQALHPGQQVRLLDGTLR